MKAVIQRVSSARVSVDGEKISEIQRGILTLLAIGEDDNEQELARLIQKIVNLRIFEDENGKMNHSLVDVRGSHLIVSQFTLYGDCSRGSRPSFTRAARPELALQLYEKALTLSQELVPTCGGKFRANMQVELVNDGPVTLILESSPR